MSLLEQTVPVSEEGAGGEYTAWAAAFSIF